jgi:hypothetical protein
MGLVSTERNARLRLDVGASGIAARLPAGVLIFDDIPIGSLVFARMTRPVELNEASDGGQGAAVPRLAKYAFELAPLPGPFAFGGVLPTTGGALRAPIGRTQARLIALDGVGGATQVQPMPVWAAFGVPQIGSLAQYGRTNHSLQMPGFTGATPNLKPADRNLLRLRWTATVVAGEAVAGANLYAPDSTTTPPAPVTADGTRRSFGGQLLGRSIAPGSFSLVVSAVGTAGAMTLRDDGKGRISGFILDAQNNIIAQGDGLIDYLAGSFVVRFGTPSGGFPTAAAAATFTAGYEKDCTYIPLDAHLEWDALEQ